jgi:uncharacterized membrane protein
MYKFQIFFIGLFLLVFFEMELDSIIENDLLSVAIVLIYVILLRFIANKFGRDIVR